MEVGDRTSDPVSIGEFTPSEWTLQEGIALCTAIQELPSQQFGCHPALTGGLLYKTGPRKDCDIVIYQRGDVDGERKEIDWIGLWSALEQIGLCLINDFGYVKKCTYKGKVVDIFDPTDKNTEYGAQAEADPDLAMEKAREDRELFILFTGETA
jgi:hypothetical protein